ncbi:MAG: hypothetical protein QOG54_383 [Actinomycetota bacterium]|jgi:hypothetical protein|nr:hypothetical protein [Actinomycetota bacterium]
MNDAPRRLVDRIVEPTYIDGYETRAIEELRVIRDECREGENEISFERRLCQARIDILSAELDHRAGRHTGDLMSRLPEILADDERGSDSPLPDRAPDLSIPRNTDIPRRRVDEIVGETTLSRLSQVPVEEIKKIIESLGEHERVLSAKRRQVHEVLDRIQEEIVRRYTSGEADPAALLR